eukprot:1255752-Prymnesium_polylepis.1
MLDAGSAGRPERASRLCEVRCCHWTIVAVLNIVREIAYGVLVVTHRCCAPFCRRQRATVLP